MSEAHPTAPAASGKPAKPYPDFPLFRSATGVWGKLHYFGPWNDPDSARKTYLEQHDGRRITCPKGKAGFFVRSRQTR